MNARKLIACVGVLGATAALAAPAFAGSLRWSGDVDDQANVHISGDRVWVDANRNGIHDDRHDLEGFLPHHRVDLRLVRTDGRGQVWIDRLPTRDNGGEAVVHISDPDPGFGHYSFVLQWDDDRGPGDGDRHNGDNQRYQRDRGFQSYGYGR